MKETPRIALIGADALALAVFLAVGIRSHWGGIPAGVLARNAVPVAVAWTVASLAFGTYRRPGLRTLMATWITAVPSGLLVRTWLLGTPSGSRILVFLGVGLAFTGLFLAVGRATLFGARTVRRGSRVVR